MLKRLLLILVIFAGSTLKADTLVYNVFGLVMNPFTTSDIGGTIFIDGPEFGGEMQKITTVGPFLGIRTGSGTEADPFVWSGGSINFVDYDRYGLLPQCTSNTGYRICMTVQFLDPSAVVDTAGVWHLTTSLTGTANPAYFYTLLGFPADTPLDVAGVFNATLSPGSCANCDDFGIRGTVSIAPVPEPATLLLMTSGAMVGIIRRRISK
jgi:hypothetical protein